MAPSIPSMPPRKSPPRPFDIYAEQLRFLNKGHPLYYPDPHPSHDAIQIADVGYIREGAFYRLFNAIQSASEQDFSVPEGFVPFTLPEVSEAIRILKGDLEARPYPSETLTTTTSTKVSRASGNSREANVGSRYSCNSSRGAVLEIEDPTDREFVDSESVLSALESYVNQYGLSWYDLADERGIEVSFGDILLITECSRTSAWNSAVFLGSTTESFEAGEEGGFSGQVQRIAPVLRRIGGPEKHPKSSRTPGNAIENSPKTETVFVKGFRTGPRDFYALSCARNIMQMISVEKDSLGDASPLLKKLHYARTSAFDPDLPDFHPAMALLARSMETTDVEIAVVHDDEWCDSRKDDNRQLVDKFAYYFLESGLISTMDDDDIHQSEAEFRQSMAAAASDEVDLESLDKRLKFLEEILSMVPQEDLPFQLPKRRGARSSLTEVDVNSLNDRIRQLELVIALMTKSGSEGSFEHLPIETSSVIEEINLQSLHKRLRHIETVLLADVPPFPTGRQPQDDFYDHDEFPSWREGNFGWTTATEDNRSEGSIDSGRIDLAEGISLHQN